MNADTVVAQLRARLAMSAPTGHDLVGEVGALARRTVLGTSRAGSRVNVSVQPTERGVVVLLNGPGAARARADLVARLNQARPQLVRAVTSKVGL